MSRIPKGAALAGIDPVAAALAAVDCTEEAILNSLTTARTTTGYQGHTLYAVPHQLIRAAAAVAGG